MPTTDEREERGQKLEKSEYSRIFWIQTVLGVFLTLGMLLYVVYASGI